MKNTDIKIGSTVFALRQIEFEVGKEDFVLEVATVKAVRGILVTAEDSKGQTQYYSTENVFDNLVSAKQALHKLVA